MSCCGLRAQDVFFFISIYMFLVPVCKLLGNMCDSTGCLGWHSERRGNMLQSGAVWRTQHGICGAHESAAELHVQLSSLNTIIWRWKTIVSHI